MMVIKCTGEFMDFIKAIIGSFSVNHKDDFHILEFLCLQSFRNTFYRLRFIIDRNNYAHNSQQYVLGVNVRYVDVKFNFTYSSYNYFLFKHFKEYHNIDESDDQKVLDSIVVLHLNGKDKPWLCNDISFSDEWDYYYDGSPFKDMVLNRRSESNPTLETIKVTFSYVFRRLTHRTPHWFVDLYLKLGDKFNLILR